MAYFNAASHAAMRYHQFLQRHKDLKMVFLELGVGYNTPVIIKFGFQRLTSENPKATYICVNDGEAYAPEDIRDKSILINEDAPREFRI